MTFVIALATAAAVGAQEAGESQQNGNHGYLYDAGIGTACVFVNLLYMPAKFVYATLGGVTGGFAYLLTGLNFEVAEHIWSPSLGGNYVVTPAHLRNQQTLYFSGTVQPD
jgi:hypothetical protein